MLGKLIKYEFKATGRTFLPLYVLIVVVATLQRLVGRDTRSTYIELNSIGDFMTFALFALFIALGVLTLIVTIQRFSKNLLGDEGYLMFTLPTSTRKLIFSKIIVAMTWIVASGAVAAISFGILFIDSRFLRELNYLMGELKYLLADLDSSTLLLLTQLPLLGILNYVQFLLVVYFSLCIGHLPPFQKHRTVVGIITFIITNMVVGWAITFIGGWVPMQIDENIVFFLLISVTLILNIIFFEGVNYILNKHLNLE